MYACSRDKPEVVEWLLDQGLKVTDVDGEQDTALHYAARFNSIESIKLLIDRGASLDALNSRSKTPLLTAIAFDNVEAVQLLWRNASLHSVSQEPILESPLQLAAEYQSIQVSYLLFVYFVTGDSFACPTSLCLSSYPFSRYSVQLSTYTYYTQN